MRMMIYAEKWDTGGIESFLINILSHIDIQSIGTIHLVVSQNITDKYDDVLNQFGVKKIVTLQDLIHSPIKRVFFNIFKMRELFEKQKYDVVHFNVCNSVTMIYAYYAKKYGVKKVIVHSHNNDIGSDAHFLKLIGHKMCRRLFSNFIDVKLACSDLAAKWLFYDESHQEIQIVNNGIDSEKFRFSEEERKRIREDLQLDDEFVIGNVGRLQQQKNQGFLIDVFADIVDKNSSARLLIVGEGEDELFLKNKAIELGLEEKIIFYGFTTKMSSVLSAMDVFVLPSLFEGFGIVNIEAQANGLPCVVSDNMPTSVCLSDDFIFLSLTESRQRWVNSILKFGNYKRDLQKNNETISKIKEVGYDIKEVAKQMEMIYLS